MNTRVRKAVGGIGILAFLIFYTVVAVTVAGRLNIPIQGLVASFVVSTLGALLLLSVLVLVRRR